MEETPPKVRRNPCGNEKQGMGANCFSCQYFHITHDPRFPYGCRAAGFKSRLLPSIEICASSGIDCLLFAVKEKIR